jgi:3-keto-disaccharide hydrolase
MKYSRLHQLIFVLLATVAFGADSTGDGHWKPLFNGQDLTGWVIMNDAAFSVTNGVIHLDKSTGWLRTEREYTNFVFEAEWRGLETNYNSGFYIRAGLEGKPHPTDAWQVNLKQTALGQLLRGKPEVRPSNIPSLPTNEWVKFRIEANGRKLTLEVNGTHAWEFDKLDVDHGYIGIQAEGRPLDFRNLRVREILDRPAKDRNASSSLESND